MTSTEIKTLFTETLQITGVSKNLEGISKDVIYNWRKNRGNPPTIGQMLEVLWQLNKIKISNESNSKP